MENGESIFVRAGTACKILGLSNWVLSECRKRGELIEGTHFVVLHGRGIFYKRAELINFFDNVSQPERHRAWLEARSRGDRSTAA